MIWLITGGCGFVGSNLADVLLSMGEEVLLFDNLSRIGTVDNLAWLRHRHGTDWQFIQADTRDQDKVSQVIRDAKPTVVAHLAGQVAMTTSLQNPRLDFEINALGTLNVLEAVRLNSPTTIVLYSSTNKVYGSLDTLRYREDESRYVLLDYPNGLRENLLLDGHSPYGCSKLTGDQYVRDYHRMYDIPTVVFRHSSMYGGRQFATFDQGWIGWFCQKALEMSIPSVKPFTINGNGKQVRDVLYADDLIEAYRLAVQNINATAGQIYNLGGGVANSLSLLELFRELETFTGNTLRFESLEWRTGDQKVFIADTYQASVDFYWQPKISQKEGLKKMLAWCKEINDIKTN